MECSRPDCDRVAILDQPYAGTHLCREHFRSSVWERFRRQMHHQAPGLSGGMIAVALSGGKDSAVALSLLTRFARGRPDLSVLALTVDEGIEGYRPATLDAARKLTQGLGIPHRVVTFQELFGVTTDRSATDRPEAPCSFCGVWRRQALNRMAREAGALRLVLGFNLDDLAQTVLMNLTRGEPFRLAQMAPHLRAQTDLVPRIAPLATLPEREVYLYARLEGLPFDHATCPYAGRAVRNLYRELVWRLEEAHPGSRHALLRTREKLLPLLLAHPEGEGPGRCPRCGEASAEGLCRACAFLPRRLLGPA